MGDNLDLALPLLTDLHHIAQVPHAPVDFNLVMQELFESGDVEDFIRGGLRGVDDELYNLKKKGY